MITHRFSKMPRREFLQQAATGAAGVALGLGLAGRKTALAEAKIPVGVELYSVRDECKQDFPGTLAAVAKIGFKGVEFAGYWGRSAKDLRKMLDDNGIVACGTHTPYETFLPENIQATIDFNQTIGNKFLICPSMSARSAKEWAAKAEFFNGIADTLKPHGMFTGYHSHAPDFRKIDGETTWDIFFSHAKPEVIAQVDVANTSEGGADPVAVLNKYPGRVRSIHIKPFGAGPEAVIGEDKIDWNGVFKFCETVGGTKWYVVEHETSAKPVETLNRTYAALQKLGKV